MIHQETHYFSVSIHPLHWHAQSALSFVFSDISREKRQVKELQDLVNYDELTQAFTRYHGMQVLCRWLEEGRSFVLGFADIDGLKIVNDQYGHLEGDQYILRVAEALRQFSQEAVISRVGGDEFMLLAEHWSQEGARLAFEGIRRELLAASGQPDALYERSISYGIVAVESSNTRHMSDLLNIADERMYAYKRNHRRTRYPRP